MLLLLVNAVQIVFTVHKKKACLKWFSFCVSSNALGTRRSPLKPYIPQGIDYYQAMDYLGDKLAVAQTHVTHWVGTVRRSFQEAMNLVTTAVTHERINEENGTRAPFKRTSSFRHFASRSRESFRRFSVRSHQRFSSLRKRHANSDPADPDQLRQCLSRPSSNSKDTNLLVQQTDGRYGTWESDRRDESFVPDMPSADPNVSPVPSSQKQTPSRLSSHSSHTETTPVSEHREDRTSSLDHSSIDMDSTDGTDGSLSTSTSVGPEGETVDFTFLDQTQVLDSSAQKNRLQLSRKRTRRAPTSKSMRKSGINQLGNKLSAVEEVDGSWMFKDSTEEKPTKQEESDEETTPRRPERSPATQSQRIPVLPMLDTSAVKLRKRPESSDSATDTTSSTPSKSPKVPLRHGSVRVLPPAPGKGDGSEEKSPPWMKELKSKKRQSLHDSRPL